MKRDYNMQGREHNTIKRKVMLVTATTKPQSRTYMEIFFASAVVGEVLVSYTPRLLCPATPPPPEERFPQHPKQF
jgi:hypothetical protein